MPASKEISCDVNNAFSSLPFPATHRYAAFTFRPQPSDRTARSGIVGSPRFYIRTALDKYGYLHLRRNQRTAATSSISFLLFFFFSFCEIHSALPFSHRRGRSNSSTVLRCRRVFVIYRGGSAAFRRIGRIIFVIVRVTLCARISTRGFFFF